MAEDLISILFEPTPNKAKTNSLCFFKGKSVLVFFINVVLTTVYHGVDGGYSDDLSLKLDSRVQGRQFLRASDVLGHGDVSILGDDRRLPVTTPFLEIGEASDSGFKWEPTRSIRSFLETHIDVFQEPTEVTAKLLELKAVLNLIQRQEDLEDAGVLDNFTENPVIENNGFIIDKLRHQIQDVCDFNSFSVHIGINSIGTDILLPGFKHGIDSLNKSLEDIDVHTA
ncbi:hypothetical protein WICPIJ_005510 [Wickerhamomyces pijperi]|uniref:Uncharacterized protein n=1 Tax=Wickerhamomyces pijperi TaxID=599730 RepID=A0A9P8Q609_WICPI|nr:hypothetical protein WICPIJ_005510 [Wickerhamomyces pijperi]